MQITAINTIVGDDYRERGSGSYASHRGELKSSWGCTVKYTEFVPEQQAEVRLLAGVLLVQGARAELGHAFFLIPRTTRSAVRLMMNVIANRKMPSEKSTW